MAEAQPEAEVEVEAETPALEDPQAVEAPEVVEEAEGEADPLPDKFKGKSADEVFRSYQELERRFHETNERQRRLEEYIAQLQQPVQQPVAQYDAVYDEDPDQAVELAHQAGDQVTRDRLLRAWAEEDPTAARTWVWRKQMEQQFAPLHQHYQALSAQQQLEQAVTDMSVRFPDFTNYTNEFVQVFVDDQNLRDQFNRTQDPGLRSILMETAYLKARDRKSDNLAATAQDVARKTTESETRAKQEAAVVTGNRTHSETRPKEDLAAAQWEPYGDHLAEGWNV